MADKTLFGVNLGGWLVLEKWMTPSLFKGVKANDEYTFCQNTPDNKALNRHRRTFFTEKDFEDIALRGYNAVRLPVGHWIFGGFEPYSKSETYVDKTFEWAKKYNLQVIIDLHTASGSQNGTFHSGKEGETEWHLNPDNISQTIDIIEKIAVKYGKNPNLYGIELLNEPSKDIPLSVLQDYYDRAYKVTKQHTKAKIIMNDAYRPLVEWEDFINLHPNSLLDVHLYQSFDNKPATFQQHIEKCFKWQNDLASFGLNKIIVGEWSASLNKTYDKMNKTEAKEAAKAYAAVQRYVFSNTAGNFYWSYKTEQDDTWNLSTQH